MFEQIKSDTWDAIARLLFLRSCRRLLPEQSPRSSNAAAAPRCSNPAAAEQQRGSNSPAPGCSGAQLHCCLCSGALQMLLQSLSAPGSCLHCRTAEPCCREVLWCSHLHTTALHCRGLLRSVESTWLTVLHQHQCSMHCAYSEPVQSARGDNVVLLQLPGQTQCSSNLQELAARQCQSTAASGVPQDMHISAH